MEEHDPIASPDQAGEEPSSLTPCRRDGWTPFARKLFLQVLAETGRVKLACDYCRLSPQSAYALRHRDPLFAAGWDAACELARAPLADALYERAMEGYDETITRDGQVVATRRRYDCRLSIAVLHRLDKRCDRAKEQGARHVPLLRRWDEWLDLVGKGEEAEAAAMIKLGPAKNAQNDQLHQLPLGEIPTASEGESVGSGEIWQVEDGSWWTDFPPPDGFDGFEEGEWGNWDYKRECTDEEAELLDRDEQAGRSALLSRAAAERDAYFAELRAELGGAA